MTVTNLARSITGGVDTHLDVHVAAALDERGTLLGVESFARSVRKPDSADDQGSCISVAIASHPRRY
jgi:hypothetical protein